LLTGTPPRAHEEFKREVQHGVTHVPDPRVDKLAEISRSKKATCVTVEYVDTPPLEAGGAKSDWFTAAVEGGIKTADALLLVARAFGAEEMTVAVDPVRDVLMVQEELVLADLIVLEKRTERLEKQHRVKPLTPEEKIEIEILKRGSDHLSAGRPLRTMALEAGERRMLRGFQFLSEKPLLTLINTSEDMLSHFEGTLHELNDGLQPHRIHAIALSAKVESEIAALPPEERAAFMSDIGVSEPARERVLQASFELLGLHSFLTTNDKESRAWAIEKGGTALEAAGIVHTDLARGFIRAEVVAYGDFVREGGYPGCKAKGLLRLEGREYVVKEGDILLIRHSG
jgi:hypothetical protein